MQLILSQCLFVLVVLQISSRGGPTPFKTNADLKDNFTYPTIPRRLLKSSLRNETFKSVSKAGPPVVTRHPTQAAFSGQVSSQSHF